MRHIQSVVQDALGQFRVSTFSPWGETGSDQPNLGVCADACKSDGHGNINDIVACNECLSKNKRVAAFMARRHGGFTAPHAARYTSASLYGCDPGMGIMPGYVPQYQGFGYGYGPAPFGDECAPGTCQPVEGGGCLCQGKSSGLRYSCTCPGTTKLFNTRQTQQQFRPNFFGRRFGY